MIYRATHITTYTYADAVAMCQNQVRLTPRRSGWQRVHDPVICIDPEPEQITTFRDYFGNQVHHFSVLEAHAKLTVSASSVVELEPPSPPEPSLTPAWEGVREEIQGCGNRAALEAFECTGESPYVSWTPEIGAWTAKIFEPGRPVLEAAVELNEKVNKEFTYVPKSTTVDTPVADVFRMRKGVCQDFAHVMIAALRSVGLAARYVSGYLRSGTKYTGAEASHAWVSVFVPPAGWVDLDPTNNMLPRDGHVTLAWGRDYGDVAPVKGVTLGGGDHEISVEVRVRPISAAEAGLHTV